MMRLTKWSLGAVLVLLAGGVQKTDAFALLGRLKNGANGAQITWQGTGFGGRPQGLGYQLAFDIGGPMTPLEGYRWNIPVITYAFDSTFWRYFGTNGVNAVEQAIGVINDLPSASAMSANLTEFPLDSRSVNQTASALRLLDVKSYTLALLLEQLGLAGPERFVWGLRDRVVRNIGGVGFTNYTVIQLNYDPVTIEESRYVNGVLYNYRIFDDLGPMGNEWASAVEWYQLDPFFLPFSSVAGGLGHADGTLGSSPDDLTIGVAGTGLAAGEYFRGLTRDDAGGLRFLLSTNNFAVESLLPDVFPASGVGIGGSPWNPFPGVTNILGSNAPGTTNVIGSNVLSITRTSLRAGLNKVSFRRVNFDSLLSTTFTPLTNRYTDTFINTTNGRVMRQKVERVIFQPDLIFAVGDLGTDPLNGVPFLARRRDTTGWSNNVALNTALPGQLALGGPGVITPGTFIIFSDLVPYFLNDVPADQDVNAFFSLIWGSFDGSDTPPVVYPAFVHPLLPNLSLQYLQNIALRRNRN